MTAIAGLWRFAGGDAGLDCRRMLDTQSLYAPDPAVCWNADGISLGRRHFRLLPEDKFDRGPALSRDTDSVLVGDVRLDNRDELSDLLGISAARAGELSDADFLLAAIDRWNLAALQKLVGDFAFAHWDPRRTRLLLARDFLGQRPLHIHHGRGFVAFASMPKGLHALEDVPREPDIDAVSRFLALMPEHTGGSFFKAVSSVPAGHVQLITPSGARNHRYWEPASTELRLGRSEDYHEAVREALDRAVLCRLRGAEGKIGTQLSGGLDSSAVTATAARLLGHDAKLTAFTAVPREGYAGPVPRGRFGDEGPGARAVAALYPQIDHVLVRTPERSPIDGLDRNFHVYERPVLNLCNGVWWDAIADAAKKRRLSVLLTGQHGNMSFSYAGMELLPDLLSRGAWLNLAGQLVRLPRHGINLEGAIAHTIGPFLPARLWKTLNRWRGRNAGISSYSAIRQDVAEEMRADAAEAGLDMDYRPRRNPFETRLWVLRRVDMGNYNKGWLGGWGLDVRDPTSDKRLVELCLSIPADVYLKKGEPRALARAAFVDRLPPEILAEKRKGLQAIDWHENLDAARDQVTRELERFSEVSGATHALDTSMLKRLVRDWPSANWASSKTTALYRLALLRAVSAGHFIRKASGSNL